LIKCFAVFYQKLIKSGEEVDWIKVTQADFDTFRASPLFQPSIHLSYHPHRHHHQHRFHESSGLAFTCCPIPSWDQKG
jgi:hypothetical protein